VPTAGTFYQNGGVHFAMFAILQSPVIIELDDDYFDALIVEVDDPLFAAEQIRARLHK